MRARVTCAVCGELIGTYERDGEINGTEVELSRELAVCPVESCGSTVKILDIIDDEGQPWYKFW